MATTKAKQTTRQAQAVEEPENKTPIVPKDVDTSQFITVRNGFVGTLVYKSSRTNELFVWTEFGGEQEMELRELRNAKNSAKAFFENNWFMFPPEYDWVIDYLGVRRFYKNALGVDGFDEIFELPADELKERLNALSDGQKSSVVYRAIALIKDGEIDSRKTIQTLEDCLGVELIEK